MLLSGTLCASFLHGKIIPQTQNNFQSSKLGRNGTGVLFAAIGALSGSKRDLATGFGVLFAGMGVLRRTAGAMSTGIIILFAAVGVY